MVWWRRVRHVGLAGRKELRRRTWRRIAEIA